MPISQLWQRIGIRGNVFRVFRADTDWNVYDGGIISMTLTRGNGSPVGVATNTAQFVLSGGLPPAVWDSPTIDVNLTAAAAGLLTVKCGTPPATAIDDLKQRWQGRIAGQTVRDTGDRRTPQWETTITASDNTTLVNAIDADAYTSTTSPGIPALVASMLYRAEIASGTLRVLDGTDKANGGFWNVKFTGGATSRLIDVATVQRHFIEECGYQLRFQRSGAPTLRSVSHMWDTINAAASGPYAGLGVPPLTRATVLNPVSWTQHITIPASVEWKSPRDNQTFQVYVDPGQVGKWPIEHLDMTDLVITGVAAGHYPLFNAMTARANRSSRYGYVLDRVTVDILDLINRPALIERQLAMHLLTLEPGDPVVLPHDWPVGMSVHGAVSVVTRITEQISARGWTVSLDLVPAAWQRGVEAPTPVNHLWDGAYPRATGWDDIPDTTTWNGAPTP